MVDVGNFTGTMIGLILTAIIFTALLPVVVEELNSYGWDSVNSGEAYTNASGSLLGTKDFGWVVYIAVIAYVLVFIALPIGAVVKLFKEMN